MPMSSLGMVLGNLNSPALGTSASHQSPATTKDNLPQCRIANCGTGIFTRTDHKQHAARATPGFQPSFFTHLKVSDHNNNYLKRGPFLYLHAVGPGNFWSTCQMLTETGGRGGGFRYVQFPPAAAFGM